VVTPLRAIDAIVGIDRDTPELCINPLNINEKMQIATQLNRCKNWDVKSSVMQM